MAKPNTNSTAVQATNNNEENGKVVDFQPVAEIQSEDSAIEVHASTENTPKTLQRVFDNLKRGNLKKDAYENYCNELEDIKEFQSGLDGSSLVLTIENNKGKKIKITSLKRISNFIDNTVFDGEVFKRKLEDELLLMSI